MELVCGVAEGVVSGPSDLEPRVEGFGLQGFGAEGFGC